VWGTASFAALFTTLLGGMLGDRFGTRRTLAVICLLLGLFGASRGLSEGLGTLTLTVFLTGLMAAAVPMNLHKVCATWFTGKSLARANAVVSGGMAFGFMLGSLISATVLSPWLGGWRGVLFLYGGITVLLAIPWALTWVSPLETEQRARGAASPSLWQALAHVARVRDVWILGIALLGVGGAVQGLLGYLPLYLRDVGWAASRADSALAGFHAISLLAVFPLAALSDRIGSRVKVLIGASVLTACGVGLLSIVDGALIWIAVLMAGAVRDGYMSVYMSTVIELDGVGGTYAGTAIGLALTVSRIGTLAAPPLGNSLASFGPRMPFVLWSAMAAFGLAALAFLKGRGRGRQVTPIPEG